MVTTPSWSGSAVLAAGLRFAGPDARVRRGLDLAPDMALDLARDPTVGLVVCDFLTMSRESNAFAAEDNEPHVRWSRSHTPAEDAASLKSETPEALRLRALMRLERVVRCG